MTGISAPVHGYDPPQQQTKPKKSPMVKTTASSMPSFSGVSWRLDDHPARCASRISPWFRALPHGATAAPLRDGRQPCNVGYLVVI